MEQSETRENAAVESGKARETASAKSTAAAVNAVEPRQASPAVVPAKPMAGALPAQMGPMPCPTCGGAGTEGAAIMTSYVYALGDQIEARYPLASIEKEMAQATGRTETAGRTDQQAFHQVLSRRENRYLARQMCWVLMIQGLETYILVPRDPADIDLLCSAIEPHDSPWISLVIGTRGPIAPAEFCNGLMIPIVFLDQLYTFSHESLIEAIPRPEGADAQQFGAASRELFDRIMQMTDNAGATDEHRALNYLAARYPAIYAKAAEEFAGNFSLSAVEVRPSPLSGARRLVDAIFHYTNRNTDFTEKFFVRCDVTEAFPYLVTKLSPYYDR
jgi:PatG C-terminal